VPSDGSDKLRELRASVFYRADVRRLPVVASRDHKDRGSTFGLYCRHAMRDEEVRNDAGFTVDVQAE